MDKLVEEYDLRLRRPECMPDAEFMTAVGLVNVDLSPVIPYLNAVIEGTAYTSKVPAINFPHDGHNMMVHPEHIAVSKCHDEDEAERWLDWLMDFVNETWQRREEIEPSYEEVEPLAALEVYRHLPGDNCGECGEPTCMAFAAKVSSREKSVDDCGPLFEDDSCRGAAQALVDELSVRGYEIPQQSV